MPVNRDKPNKWKADIAASVDMYNDWFMRFAPNAFRETRVQTTRDVESTLRSTGNLTNIRPAMMRQHPEILPTLRMSTCPPLAVDRLIGLAGVSSTLVKCMEMEKRLPVRMMQAAADMELARIAAIIERMSQLRSTYGKKVQFNLFLCGYFDSGYLGYEAAEGIDWVWEHRIDDLARFGL